MSQISDKDESSPVGGTVRGGLGDVALLEEVCHRSWRSCEVSEDSLNALTLCLLLTEQDGLLVVPAAKPSLCHHGL